MSPTPAALSLSDLVAWNPGVLRDEVSVLESSLESIAEARATLAETLELLPDVWTGISAEAIRRAISNERRYVDVLERSFLTLRRCYDTASRHISRSHDALMTTISEAENAGHRIDFSSPAGGPITVTTTAVASSNSQTDPSRLEAAHAAAKAIGDAARIVLEYDARFADEVRAAVEESESDRPPAANKDPLATAKREKSVVADRYGGIGILGPTATQLAVNGLGLVPYVAPSTLIVDVGSDMAENRSPLGDALIDAVGAKLSGRVGKTLGSGLELAGLDRTGQAVGQFFGPQVLGGGIDAVLDATVGAAGRHVDDRWGLQFFGPHTNEQLARQALRDQESGR